MEYIKYVYTEIPAFVMAKPVKPVISLLVWGFSGCVMWQTDIGSIFIVRLCYYIQKKQTKKNLVLVSPYFSSVECYNEKSDVEVLEIKFH